MHPRNVAVKNISTGTILAAKCQVADSFLTRLKGLLGKGCLPSGGGLLIYPCNMIHTLGMRFPLDVLFISSDKTIIAAIENMKINRVSPLVKGAESVVELPAGQIKATDTSVGDKIALM